VNPALSRPIKQKLVGAPGKKNRKRTTKRGEIPRRRGQEASKQHLSTKDKRGPCKKGFSNGAGAQTQQEYSSEEKSLGKWGGAKLIQNRVESIFPEARLTLGDSPLLSINQKNRNERQKRWMRCKKRKGNRGTTGIASDWTLARADYN